MKNKKDENNIIKVLEGYKENLHAISFYFEKFGNIAENKDEDALLESRDSINKCFKEAGIDLDKIDNEEANEEQIEKKISKESILKMVKKITRLPKISDKNYEILSSSAFLMLNNYFEYLLSDLLTYYYSRYKDSLNSKELKVNLKEINEYESIKELEESLILKEVEAMLLELTFDSLLSHFEKKLKIDLSYLIINWDKIKESRERRHIIVHNGSIVNKKYLSRTSNPYKLKLGEKVTISKEYFQAMYTEFKIAGYLLSFDCWGNWESNTANKAIGQMLDESFECLRDNDIETAFRITQYTEQIKAKNEEQEDLLLRLKFNHCIALKKRNKKNDLNKVLKTIKVGTAAPLFKLAHSILAEKNEETILELVEKTYMMKDLYLSDYLEWPLFEFTRNREELNQKILEVIKN